MNELAPFDARVGSLLAAVAPAARAQLARALAQKLRESQGRRIAGQLNPDGSPYAPRKRRLRAKKGFLRRPMFSKLRTTKWMKTEASPASAVVTFVAQVQHMAQVHQLGLRDRVNLRGGPEVVYPMRELFGLTDPEIGAIEDELLDHLSGALL